MTVVTYEMGLARGLSNHVDFLHQGRIDEEGDPREVLACPASPRLPAFLSSSLK